MRNGWRNWERYKNKYTQNYNWNCLLLRGEDCPLKHPNSSGYFPRACMCSCWSALYNSGAYSHRWSYQLGSSAYLVHIDRACFHSFSIPSVLMLDKSIAELVFSLAFAVNASTVYGTSPRIRRNIIYSERRTKQPKEQRCFYRLCRRMHIEHSTMYVMNAICSLPIPISLIRLTLALFWHTCVCVYADTRLEIVYPRLFFSESLDWPKWAKMCSTSLKYHFGYPILISSHA